MAVTIEDVGGILCESWGIRQESALSTYSHYGFLALGFIFLLACVALAFFEVRKRLVTKKPQSPENQAKLQKTKGILKYLYPKVLLLLIGAIILFFFWYFTRVPYDESTRSLHDAGCAGF
jgi:Na+/H+ antiporter NhaC